MADSALTGAVIGGAISLISALIATFGAEWIKQRREARNLAYAFRGGITAILTIVNARGYHEQIVEAVVAGRAGQQLMPMKLFAKRNYIELYSKNVDRIGILTPTLAQLIPTFYICVNSLLEDIDAMAGGQYDDASQEILLHFYEQFGDLLGKTMDVGAQIISIVDEKYPPSWAWVYLPG